MIKVLIADDEPLVRAGIKTVLPWNMYGFDVIADDGVADVATFEWVQMSAHTMNLVNAVGRDTWTATYNAINMANQVAFSDLGESILASDPQKESQFKAEASFIRSL